MQHETGAADALWRAAGGVAGLAYAPGGDLLLLAASAELFALRRADGWAPRRLLSAAVRTPLHQCGLQLEVLAGRQCRSGVAVLNRRKSSLHVHAAGCPPGAAQAAARSMDAQQLLSTASSSLLERCDCKAERPSKAAACSWGQLQCADAWAARALRAGASPARVVPGAQP